MAELKPLIARIADGKPLSVEEARTAFDIIMSGNATPSQIGAVLMGLRVRGETVDEITGAVMTMREKMTRVSAPADAIDIVGTGGDGSGTFNVSTTSMFVAAGAGCHVAKHGNRSVSSKSGAADVLEAAGIQLDLTPEQVARCVLEVGVGFMFAPAHHSAMKHAIGPRRELGVRTLFNVLGPLTNPAGVPNQLLGVFSEELLEPLAQVLQRLGSRHVLVVCSRDGLDEISIADRTDVAELKDGHILRYSIAPEELGLARAGLEAIQVDGPIESLELLQGVLDDRPGPARDIVVLNAGAAIYAAGCADDLAGGIALADETIARGKARACFDALVAFTRDLA